MPDIDKNFYRIISSALPGLSSKLSASMRGLDGRPPISLGDTANPSPDPLDLEAVSKFFNADSAGQTYNKAITGQGQDFNQVWVKIAAKIQSDTLSQLERDYKMMTHSRVRAMAFEASRKGRQASQGGPIFNNILQGGRLWYNLTKTNG